MLMKSWKFCLVVLAGSIGYLGTAEAQAKPPYVLTKTIALGGATKWDYLYFDAPSQRLFISHGDQVQVLNGKTGALIGTLTGLPGSHGIAVDPQTGIIYADSAKNQTVTLFDAKSFKPIKSLPVAEDADGMVYDPASHQIFVVGGDGNAITPVNTKTQKQLPDIALGGTPEFLAADGKGSLYVNINDKNTIVRIDTATNAITATWPTAPCVSPTGLAIDKVHRLLFSSCHSGVMLVMNADTGQVVGTLPIGTGTDAAAYDAVRKRVFSSNADGTLNIITGSAPQNFTDISMATAEGARTLAVDPRTGRIYLVTATVVSKTPPATPGGRPHYEFAPGSVRLLIFDPVK
ncbi:MAG: hypothetical protein B7Z75_04805 [Acidocella sp. 20-57-95]|nr:MAG: hypothetical protein B7Z75_04805 [Acidocella sp. 20-57-95]OYV59973.1 MAG: hypothetical protein B7Z71_07015 [Acidocella sp. 21-58-7]HQT64329.1 hypothetical protein [Acidocella sp.]HQU03806.1 hypothetical protein [Acidocella sp.]